MRLISLTGTGVRFPGDKITLIDRILNLSISIIDPKRIKDGKNHVTLLKNSDLDWYVMAKNLLNQDIRYSTTVETLRLYAPQAARSVSGGVKWSY